jgi:hypothetical protein
LRPIHSFQSGSMRTSRSPFGIASLSLARTRRTIEQHAAGWMAGPAKAGICE